MTTKNGYVRTEKDHLFDLRTNYKVATVEDMSHATRYKII